MALTRQLAELLLAEHKYRPIRGEILLLGRQMIFMTPDQAMALVEEMGVRLLPGASIEFDRTPHGRERGFISDRSFFGLFSDGDVRACDVSDYEGADIIFDLSGQLPANVVDAFDFIYNGSVLDNVFDPATCMRNVTHMLRSGGVSFGYEGVAHFGAAYLKFSPEWFFDYYAVNAFVDAQVYYCTAEHFHRSAWRTYQWDAFVADGDGVRWTPPMSAPSDAHVIAIAEKADDTTADRVPLQNLYRPDHAPYQTAFRQYAASARRTAISSTLRSPTADRGTFWRRLSGRRATPVPGYKLIGMLGVENPTQPF